LDTEGGKKKVTHGEERGSGPLGDRGNEKEKKASSALSGPAPHHRRKRKRIDPCFREGNGRAKKLELRNSSREKRHRNGGREEEEAVHEKGEKVQNAFEGEKKPNS